MDAPDGIVDWWVVDGDVVTVAARSGTVTVRRWAPPGHRGVSWTWQGTGPASALEHGRTWLRIGAGVLDLSTGRTIATPADAVALPAWASVLGPDDGSSGVPVITDGTQVVVAGLRHYPGPAHLLVHGVIVTGTDEVTAHRTSDGLELWRAAASAAFSDGVAVGLIELGLRRRADQRTRPGQRRRAVVGGRRRRDLRGHDDGGRRAPGRRRGRGRGAVATPRARA